MEEKKMNSQQIEGRNAVMEAFRSGKPIDKVYILDGCQDGPIRSIVREAKKHDTILNFVTKERLNQISETGRHQGVIAQAAAYEYAQVEDLLELAKQQVGNVGGYPYWSWYGFNSRVEWCACFVSWCYNQAGKSEPRFAGCEWQGVPWFQSRGQWGARGYENIAPGDAIFFDWDLDGVADHVGLVLGRDGSRVYTVEGNSGDACKIKSYDLNYQCIKGYGLMNW